MIRHLGRSLNLLHFRHRLSCSALAGWLERFSEAGTTRFHYIAGYLQAEFRDQELSAAYGQCPYFLDQRTGTCSMGCREEPECMTCCPSEGWPEEPGPMVMVRGARYSIENGLKDWRTDHD